VAQGHHAVDIVALLPAPFPLHQAQDRTTEGRSPRPAFFSRKVAGRGIL